MFRKLALYAVGIVSFLILFSAPASANGEIYTWKDYNTIEVSGGDLNGTGILKLEPNTSPQEFLSEYENPLIHKNPKCTVNLKLTLGEDSSTARITHSLPPNEIQNTTDSYSTEDYIPSCSSYVEKEGIDYPHNEQVLNEDGTGFATFPVDAAFPGVSEKYNNKTVTIGGARPGSSEQSESPSQKEVWITIHSPDHKDESPDNIEMTITGSGGYSKTFNVEKETSDGRIAASYYAKVELDPGEYELCWTGVIPQCKSFIKVKFNSLSLKYGETASDKRVTVTVQLHDTRGCTNEVTYSGRRVTLTNLGDDSSRELTTDEFVAGPMTDNQRKKEEDEYPCNINFIVSDIIVFENVDPGTYEVCTDNGRVCATITKKAGEEAEVTLAIKNDFLSPQSQPVCNTGTGFAGFLAFIICPLTSLILSATEIIQQNLIIPYLTVSPLEVGSTIYILWESFRNLANIALIIAFLIIIFSQATSIGISNYGVKKLLPRIFLVAVGINLSFFIVSLAVDTFNVLGAGIADLVLAAIPQVGGSDPNVAQGSVAALVSVGGLAVAAAITSVGAVLGWLWGLVLGAFIAVIIAMIVLVLRQMVIIILVILSPLAFVAWLLPNTSRYFTKWRQLLIQMLVMYPLIILLFSIGKIFTALINAGEYQFTASGGIAEDVSESVRVLMGFVASVAPLALLPVAFATAGNMMSGIQKRLQDASGKARTAAGSEIKGSLKPKVKKLGYNMALGKYDNKLKKIPFVGSAAAAVARGVGHTSTIREKREAKRANQEAELNRQNTAIVAQHAKDKEGFRRRAVFGDKQRADSMLSESQRKLETLEREELKTNESLYNNILKETNQESKTFANGALNDYLTDGIDEVKNDSGNTIFKFSENSGVLEAMLDRAAREGNISVIEEARMSQQLASGEGQKMVDRVISNNKGAVVSNGGFHLANGDPTKSLGYGMAIGRAEDENNNLITDSNQLHQRMAKIRLETMSGQGAGSIAGWDYGMHEVASKSLEGASGQALLANLSDKTKDDLRTKLDQVLTPGSDTYNKVENVAALQNIRSKL